MTLRQLNLLCVIGIERVHSGLRLCVRSQKRVRRVDAIEGLPANSDGNNKHPIPKSEVRWCFDKAIPIDSQGAISLRPVCPRSFKDWLSIAVKRGFA